MRKVLALAIATAGLVGLAGCAGGVRAKRWRHAPDLSEAVVEAAIAPLPPSPDQVPGTPPIRVTWEALARSKPGGTLLGTRAPVPPALRAPPPEMKIVLVNASHPEAIRMRLLAVQGRSQRFEAEKAVIPDADMLALIENFDQLKFFRYAEPTAAVASLFPSERSRGRITVERGGESVTLLAQYGQGLQESTRPIPGIYVDAKKLVAVLKNRTPHLSVTSFRASDPRKPAPPK